MRLPGDPDDGLCFCCRKDVAFGAKPKPPKKG